MKNHPLVANKQGICSRHINRNAIWVWAENNVNSGVLLHLHHQTLQFFGEPPVPTDKWQPQQRNTWGRVEADSFGANSSVCLQLEFQGEIARHTHKQTNITLNIAEQRLVSVWDVERVVFCLIMFATSILGSLRSGGSYANWSAKRLEHSKTWMRH